MNSWTKQYFEFESRLAFTDFYKINKNISTDIYNINKNCWQIKKNQHNVGYFVELWEKLIFEQKDKFFK